MLYPKKLCFCFSAPLPILSLSSCGDEQHKQQQLRQNVEVAGIAKEEGELPRSWGNIRCEIKFLHGKSQISLFAITFLRPCGASTEL
jgi:hypothetical protein